MQFLKIVHLVVLRLTLSGSIGLEPVLMQAGLSANKNVFPPFEPRILGWTG